MLPPSVSTTPSATLFERIGEERRGAFIALAEFYDVTLSAEFLDGIGIQAASVAVDALDEPIVVGVYKDVTERAGKGDHYYGPYGGEGARYSFSSLKFASILTWANEDSTYQPGTLCIEPLQALLPNTTPSASPPSSWHLSMYGLCASRKSSITALGSVACAHTVLQ